MRYKPKMGDKFTIKGRNIVGETIHSKCVYTCIMEDSTECIATNKELTYHFKNSVRNFEYIKELES